MALEHVAIVVGRVNDRAVMVPLCLVTIRVLSWQRVLNRVLHDSRGMVLVMNVVAMVHVRRAMHVTSEMLDRLHRFVKRAKMMRLEALSRVVLPGPMISLGLFMFDNAPIMVCFVRRMQVQVSFTFKGFISVDLISMLIIEILQMVIVAIMNVTRDFMLSVARVVRRHVRN